ncbi:hypothetical protein TrVE_jg9931 [Triparma verrucosa]|uniref:Uncharacterized protein n=1 Tax=Triparma verrucosa TaxID=1606542 RepID=A0A9W7BW71_9STRA|nr:hypothetical protein TrVE_jg9931 [Triparma verrucosa]
MDLSKMQPSCSVSSSILLMSAISSDSASTASTHLNSMANLCAQDDSYRMEALKALEENLADTNGFVSGWEGKVAADFVALIIAVSGPRVSASDIMDVLNGKGSPALLLMNVALNNKLYEEIRGQSVFLLAELGIPSTYLIQNATLTSPRKSSNKTKNYRA